jgi:predicted metal-dependent HD superfamily phosphohydrolase
MDSLKLRFNGLCNQHLFPTASFDTNWVSQDILQKYAQPLRRYHNQQHLIHCLEQLDQVKHLIPHADAVEMALWFHDAIYVPGKTDNEQKSSELFLEYALDNFPVEFIRQVERLILVTTHKHTSIDFDERFIADIDLSSFGLDWGDFLVDSQNLREERLDIPDSAYFQAHTQFLKHLMSRSSIFQTQPFFDLYEQTAKQNITRLLLKRKAENYE